MLTGSLLWERTGGHIQYLVRSSIRGVKGPGKLLKVVRVCHRLRPGNFDSSLCATDAPNGH